tara:strand:+ start:20 stop:517 length:498 start_codon:yes stop_codon:yes gene_type:complete
MPTVKGKKFPYTKDGIEEAEAYAAAHDAEVEYSEAEVELGKKYPGTLKGRYKKSAGPNDLLKSWADGVLDTNYADTCKGLVHAALRQELRAVYKKSVNTPVEKAAKMAADKAITGMAINGGMMKNALGFYMAEYGFDAIQNAAKMYATDVVAEFRTTPNGLDLGD